MAGETILVVDDSAVNLKLAAAVLRSDGYRVLLASNAEQALMILRTTLPDLLLVDLQLPGMNGLELTQHLRQEPRTRKLLVVALTASVMQGCEQAAYDAGCDGFIPKPIDPRTLGPCLRNFLEGPTVAPETGVEGGGLSDAFSLPGPEMESLRRSFLVDGLRQVRRMLECVGSDLDVTVAARQFHEWIGAAGALGYMEIAGKARAAEGVLNQPDWIWADLRQVLTALAYAFASPREAADTAIPSSIAQELEGKRIALVGFADEEAERVCVAFERVRALPRTFVGDEPPDCDSIRDCSVVMVHVREQTRNVPWLQREFVTRQPLVLVGGRDDLLGLPPSVQSRACEFLIDDWQLEEVIMRLSFAIARGAAGAVPTRSAVTGRPSIVIADDNVHILAVVRHTLESLGMECRFASSGTEAMRMIRERCPQVAVLDVNMPGMDGFEVLTCIRESELAVKVIMLTARQHERDVLRGFELGADDYVVKPFIPLELVARLKRFL